MSLVIAACFVRLAITDRCRTNLKVMNSSAAASFSAVKSQEALKLRFAELAGNLTGLSEVENLVAAKLDSEAALLTEIGHYLLSMGGKRIRPILCLLVARVLGVRSPPSQLIEVAAGIELIHMATLLHDDIIDKSPLRRHRESPFKKFGAESTLLCGDFLLTRAFSLCAHLDEFVINATERACIDLTEGEILETPLFQSKHTVDTSLTIARKKTASLFRLAALTAAHIAGLPEELVRRMGDFAENLGVAFQILDDILDVTADERTLGKQSGIDLHERKPSLVNVLWQQEEGELSRRLSAPPAADDSQWVQAALAELRGSRAIEKAQRYALNHAEAARAALDEVVAAHATVSKADAELLQMLVDFTVARDR